MRLPPFTAVDPPPLLTPPVGTLVAGYTAAAVVRRLRRRLRRHLPAPRLPRQASPRFHFPQSPPQLARGRALPPPFPPAASRLSGTTAGGSALTAGWACLVALYTVELTHFAVELPTERKRTKRPVVCTRMW